MSYYANNVKYELEYFGDCASFLLDFIIFIDNISRFERLFWLRKQGCHSRCHNIDSIDLVINSIEICKKKAQCMWCLGFARSINED